PGHWTTSPKVSTGWRPDALRRVWPASNPNPAWNTARRGLKKRFKIPFYFDKKIFLAMFFC
ncbi:MAG: hypothetical protein AB1896_09915, partial [Thermodesulfobacteriota bacterium]